MTPLSRTLAALAAVVALLGAPSIVRAEDELDAGRVIAVEPRPYRMIHEFSAFAGVVPLDALYTGYSLGGSYTLHFSDLWAWEAIDFHYSANVKTGLDVTLADRWSVVPTKSPQFEYLAGSCLVLKPLFGKLTLFNSNIIYAETYLAFGGGLAHFSDGFRPQVSAGPGVRVFFSQRASARLDVRSLLSPDIPSGVDHVMQITLGVSFNFGTVPKGPGEDAFGQELDETTGFEALDELYPASNPERPKARPAAAKSAGSDDDAQEKDSR